MIALVTGGNRGLGLETARQLAQRGHRVLVTSRDVAQGREAARLLLAANLAVEHHPLDVTDAESVAALAENLAREGLRLDVLVNNAGVASRGCNAEMARRVLDVNFFGVERVTDALLPLLRDGANVVMVSSQLGELSVLAPGLRRRFTDPQLTREALDELMRSFIRDVEQDRHEKAGWPASPYRVSKVGLNALTRLLARKHSARRIRVNAVCPGWVRTDMGGPGASRSVEAGAGSIVWAALLDDGQGGGFFRDGIALPW
jgi:NAD(P)-dependent dehydrogenase (short-subunit alcohol dehydrogenase family)